MVSIFTKNLSNRYWKNGIKVLWPQASILDKKGLFWDFVFSLIFIFSLRGLFMPKTHLRVSCKEIDSIVRMSINCYSGMTP